MDNKEDCTYFHGTVHPSADQVSRGINYSIEALRECCARLPGTPLTDYHYEQPVGEIVHAYIGKDSALHTVGRVHGDGLEATLMQVMIERGLRNALSLAQNVTIDQDDGRVDPVGNPVGVGLIDVKDSGRGPACTIDSHARWSDIEGIMRSGVSGNSPKNPGDILQNGGGDEGNQSQSNAGRRKLAEIVWKIEMDKTTTTPPNMTTTTAAATPVQAITMPGAAASTTTTPAPAQQAAPKSAELSETEMLKMATAKLKELMEENKKLKSGVQQPLKEQTKALLRAIRMQFNKMYAGKMSEAVDKAVTEMENKVDPGTDEEIHKMQPQLAAMCAASADGSEYARQASELAAEAKAQREESKRLREENDRIHRDVETEWRQVMGTVGGISRVMTNTGADFTTKVEMPAPPMKQRAIETPLQQQPAAVPVPQAQGINPRATSVLSADEALWEHVMGYKRSSGSQ
jgi:hypothetical protein